MFAIYTSYPERWSSPPAWHYRSIWGDAMETSAKTRGLRKYASGKLKVGNRTLGDGLATG